MPSARSLAALRPVLALLAACALGLGACESFKPGGSGRSDDTFTYPSTASNPATVSLVDTRTGETIWTNEVPVGLQLVVKFVANPQGAQMHNPDTMRWGVMNIGQTSGQLTNAMSVPPSHARRLDYTVRPQGR